MNRAVALSAGLAVAGVLAFLYWRNRGSGAAGDALEEIAVTARRLLDPPTEQPTGTIAKAVEQVREAIVPKPSLPSGTRGIRNNNPGNIRKSGDQWVGLSDVQTDREFFQFTEPKWGVRALAKILLNYEKRYGLRTVRDIINRWAPPIGQRPDGTRYTQDSSAYVAAVARRLGVQADQAIDVNARLPDLALAIIIHENGRNPYAVADINSWVRLK